MCARNKISGPDVSFESFEGEILIINLGNGNYHSLRGVAVPIWTLVIAGQNGAEIAALWPDEVGAESDINAFVEALRSAGLIVSRDDAPVESVAAPESLPEFSAPEIENFTDMQDLLMLDPIHEVDVEGWPKQPEDHRQTSH
jgi:hypothetical protein